MFHAPKDRISSRPMRLPHTRTHIQHGLFVQFVPVNRRPSHTPNAPRPPGPSLGTKKTRNTCAIFVLAVLSLSLFIYLSNLSIHLAFLALLYHILLFFFFFLSFLSRTNEKAPNCLCVRARALIRAERLSQRPFFSFVPLLVY